MKFCYECGYKLEGFEKFCPECGKEFKNSNETKNTIDLIFNQVIDDIDELKKETMSFLEDFDIEDAIDDFSKNSKKALNRDIDYINRARRKIDVPGEDMRVIELCNKAIAIDEFNWEAYFLKGVALYNLRRYNEAIEELINSLALNEENLEARLYISKAYYYKGNAEYAHKVLDSILDIDDKYFEALKCKAVIFFHKRNYGDAKKYFKKASIIKPLSADAQAKFDICLKKIDEE